MMGHGSRASSAERRLLLLLLLTVASIGVAMLLVGLSVGLGLDWSLMPH
jgi:hypothetical protein